MSNDRHVEISLDLNPEGLRAGLQESEELMRNGVRRIGQIQQEGQADLPSFMPPQGAETAVSSSGAAVSGADYPSPPQPSFPTDEYVAPPPSLPSVGPSMPNPQPDASGGGKLDELNQRLNVIQQMSQRSPDVAKANLDRLRVQSLNASLKEPERAEEYQKLIEALDGLKGTVSEDSKKKDSSNEFFQWMRANAGMQLGQQVVGNLQQGRFFSAAGGAAGGMLGLIGGPGGMAIGSAIGTSIGGFIEGLAGGAQGARQYERSATDIARQFGSYDQISNLHNYNLGGQYGYKAEESLGMIDSLRESRVVNDAAEATPLVTEIQRLTRALGLNADATTKLYSNYATTGGDRGPQDYFADVVQGAIEAGFESNVDQYAELMGSARQQVMQQSGQGVSDRAFDMMQDVFTALTGSDSDTSELFSKNPMMAGGALNTFMGMGGTNDVYGMGAGFLRLAGVSENQLDRRFTSAEQQAQNAGKALDFLGDRMIERSGMSREEFQASARADSNFVQSQLQENVGLQRETDFMLSGLLGRQASAQDLRAFEQLQNIAMSNGGQLPTSGQSGSEAVDKLLAEMGQTPADKARQAEAERHNKQMEVMSNFQNLMTKTDQWMADIYGWISENVDLKAIEETIISAMEWIEGKGMPAVLDASEALIKWVEDNNIFGTVSNGIKTIVEAVQEFFANPGKLLEGVGVTARNVLTGTSVEERSEGGFRGLGRGAAVAAGALSPAIPGANVVTGGLSHLRRRNANADDEFGDTPAGGVVATESYNTFRFAPGDRVVASRTGAPNAGGAGRESTATLDDVLMLEREFIGLVTQHHKENLENFGLSQEVREASLELTELLQKDSEMQTGKLLPEIIEQQKTEIDAVREVSQGIAVVNSNLPILGQLIAGVRDAIGAINSVMGFGRGGTGGGLLGGVTNEITQRYQTTLPHLQDYGVARDGGRRRHAGVDFDISGADATAVSFLGGEVTRVGNDPGGYGKYVDVYNAELGVVERIAEAADLLVELGDTVAPGQAIGKGESQTGVIHYEIRTDVNSQNQGGFGFSGTVNPINFLEGVGIDPYAPIAEVFAGVDPAALGAAPAGMAGGSESGTYQPNVSPEFQREAYAVAERLGVRPEYLMAVMGFETGGTYSPSITNAAGSGATGLIQFMPSTARGLGTSTGALAQMSNVEQLKYVEEYLRPYAGDLNSLEDTYMSVLYPDAIGRGAGHTLFNQGTIAYRQNRGLDIDRDGRVTVGEATNKVREYLPASMGPSQSATGFASGASQGYTPEPLPQFNTFTPGGGNNIQASINVSVNAASGDAETVRQAALEGTQAATDEFERQWRQDSNPRNNEMRSAAFA